MNSLNHHPSTDLNAVFSALADPTRRAILARLREDDGATVAELAAPFSMSQPAISKHLKVLERANLVTRSAAATTRPATLNPAPMQDAVAWLEQFQDFWTGSLDQLDALLGELTTQKPKGKTRT